MYTIIFGLFIAYLWFNPEVVSGFTYWLSSPMNSIIALIVLIIVLVALYKWRSSKRVVK
jgi:uncharacterized membrane protein